MIRRTLLMCLGLSIAAPLAAQVGYPPDQSPFQDLRGRQSATITAGYFLGGSDFAGVSPGNGPMFAGRYELLLTGPLWLTSRVAYAPGLERTVLDPETTGPGRVVGTSTEQLVIGDVGFAFNLTGNKSWRRVAPRISGSLGFASTFSSNYDLGGYRFGTKFLLGYGIGTRIVTGSAWELDVDLNRTLWQMKYPDSYSGDGSPSDETILGDRPTGPWVSSTILSVGVSRYFFR